MEDNLKSWFVQPDQGQRPQQRQQQPQDHIARNGIYQEWINTQAIYNRRPNVYHPDWKVPRERDRESNNWLLGEKIPAWHRRQLCGRAACITLSKSACTDRCEVDRFEPRNPETKFFELTRLCEELKKPCVDGRKRLFLLESTDPDFVAVFGEAFKMDPSIFARHQRTALWEFRHRAGNIPPLASYRNDLLSFKLEYSELRNFSREAPFHSERSTLSDASPFVNLSARNPLDHRHIGITKLKSTIQKVGLLHRKATYWAKVYPDKKDAWDALIIVDPPLPDRSQLPNSSAPPSQAPWPGRYEYALVGDSKSCREALFYGEPYQGGYQDFIPMEDVQEASTLTNENRGPKRISIFDDLLYYWTYHTKHTSVGSHPVCSTFFLQKIIASEYNLLIEYLRGALCETEWVTQLSHAEFKTAQIEAQWSDMQSWATRCREYNDFVDDILECREALTSKLRDLEISSTSPNNPAATTVPAISRHFQDWEESCRDFQSIRIRLGKIRDRCDLLVTSYNALAGMVGNRQAVMEAKRVTVLTILAMVFLPLSFVVGLFGTNPPWAPGQPEQWKLYVSMATITVGVILLAFVAHFGFADEGQWRLSRVFVNLRIWIFSWPPRLLDIFTRGWTDVTKSKRG